MSQNDGLTGVSHPRAFLKRYPLAITALTEALRIQPRASAARLMRAEIYERRAEFDAPLKDTLAALRDDNALIAAHVRVARLLCRMKHANEATPRGGGAF
ncbi:MAG: hypothetical protein ACKVPX_14935 [Myxococcaceae bacterium]